MMSNLELQIWGFGFKYEKNYYEFKVNGCIFQYRSDVFRNCHYDFRSFAFPSQGRIYHFSYNDVYGLCIFVHDNYGNHIQVGGKINIVCSSKAKAVRWKLKSAAGRFPLSRK
jgi:hypothetical protein